MEEQTNRTAESALPYVQYAVRMAAEMLKIRGIKVFEARLEIEEDTGEVAAYMDVTGYEFKLVPDLEPFWKALDERGPEAACEPLILDILLATTTMGLATYQKIYGELDNDQANKLIEAQNNGQEDESEGPVQQGPVVSEGDQGSSGSRPDDQERPQDLVVDPGE